MKDCRSREGNVLPVALWFPLAGEGPTIATVESSRGNSSLAAAHQPIWRRRESVLAAALVVLVLVMGLLQPRFLHPENLRDILVNASIPAVAAAGMTVLIIAAHIDISVGAILAVCAVVVALLGRQGVPLPAVFIAAAVAGGLLGSVNGALTAWLKIPSIVATLATLGAIRGLLVLVTGGNSIDAPPSLSAFGQLRLIGLPACVWGAAAAVAAMGVYLACTAPGRRHYAIGSSVRSAALSGVRVDRVAFLSFVILGALVGVAGFLFVSRFTPVYPTPPRGFELEVITAVVVGGTDIFGGRGTVLGTVLAALLLSAIGIALTFITSIVPNLRSEIQPAVQGLLILMAVLYNSLSRREP